VSNFAFLKGEWPEIHPAAARAEALALTDPRGACFYARRTLELAVSWVYAHDPALSAAYEDSLSARLHHAAFRGLVPYDVFPKLRLIKDLGNEAVHSAL
jgi:type I restriction enzyme R subunit